ncbi:TetR/AcrR family transcriptional regulator [Pedomonas mirosovicensis]|uniref:TetR/AcrR family transcriptional regulator n=1 Tax=Pedomonas mirosovicensis TaxID=2908641 RepID=UPI0021678835|nr:TetR/AcrR family transcriptional regulator [Pedomonas mirosovicensis]MCH8685530.1 TetR/AcrR family transcriptional regulator [Pedomonas mirosovicensis]
MSAGPVDTNPRKLPRQARARATVDMLLEATAQVLLNHGYEHATTARIADRAGVSIGSLYQYFPNKEALIAALIERHTERIVAAVAQALADPAAAPLEEGLRSLVRVGLDTHRIAPALHKILAEQVPRVGRMAEVMDTSRRITQLIEAYLCKHAAQLPPDRDPALEAQLLETTLEALCHMVVIQRPDLLATRVIEQEILRILAACIGLPAPAPSTSPR